MTERLFTRTEIMALVHRIFDELRNGRTMPTLGAVEARLNEELSRPVINLCEEIVIRADRRSTP